MVLNEEGRYRWTLHNYLNGTTGYGWETDYFEKDHLGNTRVVLTQEKDTAQYVATMEAAYRAKEMALFYNIDSTSYPSASVPGGYPADAMTNPNDSVARVNGNGHKMGPALLLKVMSGDSIAVGVKSFYRSNGSPGSNNNSLPDVVNSLAQGLLSLAGPGHGTVTSLSASGSPVYAALNSFLPAKETATAGKPKAYLNWMMLDNQFNYVSGQSGALQVGNSDVLNTLAQGVGIHHSGYLYIWVSNETQSWDVFFDNLSVNHYSGPMVEENHYYAYGLTMAGISDKALKSNYAENKYRFNNGTELANKEFSDGSGLEMYETPFRGYDPQLGRFHQLDPLADITESYSPYAFALNNPISYNDAWGLAADSAGKPKTDPAADVKEMPAAIVAAKKKDCVTCDAVEKDFGPAPTSVPAPIKGGSAAAFTTTIGVLGDVAEGSIIVTGGASSIPILYLGVSLYGFYSVSQMHLGAPILNVPNSDIRRYAPAIALPGYVGGQPTQRVYTYATEPWGEQYTLRAAADGLYPVFEWSKGLTRTQRLNRGDIWKIGTTINGSARYSQSFYETTGAGLNFVPEFYGPVFQTLIVERMKLLNYQLQNYGSLPPGNTKLQ
jgi:RHS repeat-associated protein